MSWGLLVATMGFIAAAQPPTQLGFFSRLTIGVTRSYWDRGDLAVALVFAGFAWVASLAALALYHRRPGADHLHRPTLVACLVAPLGIAGILALLV